MDRGVYNIMRVMVKLLGFVPPSLLRALGRLVGGALYWIDRRHRTIARKNLRFAYGDELTEAQVQKLARECFKHLGRTAAELFWLFSLTPQRIRRSVKIHGLANLRQTLASGRGVMMISGHFGNWEFNGLATGHLCGRIRPIGRPLDYPPLDRLIRNLRTRWGNDIIPKLGSMRLILRALRQGEMVGFLADQNVDWYDGVFVRLFSRRACTNKGPALIWLATRSPALPVYSFYARGKHHIVYGPPFKIEPDPDKTKAVEAVTQSFNAFFEAAVRLHPEQWMWLHHRWKTRPYHLWPKGTREPYGPNVAPARD